MGNCIDIILCVAEVIIWQIMLDTLLERKENIGNKSYIISDVIMFIGLLMKTKVFAISGGYYEVIFTVGVMALMMIQIYLLYEAKLREKILSVILYTILSTVCDVVVMLAIIVMYNLQFDIFYNDNIYRNMANVMARMLMYIFVKLLVSRKNKNRQQYNITTISLVSIDAILFLVLFYINMYCIEISTEIFMTAIGLSLIIITSMAFYMYRLMEKKSQEMVDARLQIQHMNMQLTEYQDIREMYEKMRIMKHDYINHIALIDGLYRINEYEELERYLNQLTQKIKESNTYEVYANKALETVINYKKGICEKEDIDIQLDINVIDIMLKDIEITALIANLIDNSIEAVRALDSDRRHIYFSMNSDRYRTDIICENNYEHKPTLVNGQLVTSKANKEEHGIGTKVIRNIVERYNGKIEYTIDKGRFKATIQMRY